VSCLSLPDFTLYQTFADGRDETHHITSFIPETLKSDAEARGHWRVRRSDAFDHKAGTQEHIWKMLWEHKRDRK